MRQKLALWAASALVALSATPAYAWDELGHSVVGRIAWDNLTPQARARAIAILRGAPPGSGLGGILPPGAPESRQAALFVSASTWPDEIRSDGHPGHQFAKSSRHFVNVFWRQRSDFSRPEPLPNQPLAGDLLNDFPGLRAALTGPNRADAAVALAWIIHLVGDIHQPLHSSSRVTPRDALPAGDRGGNSYELAGRPDNLHAFWDGSLTRNNLQRPGESRDAFVARVAAEIQQAHPASGFTTERAATDLTGWAREGVTLAQTVAYRPPLRRGQRPPPAYNRRVFEAAQRRAALGGYRLADLLNQALGSGA